MSTIVEVYCNLFLGVGGGGGVEQGCSRVHYYRVNEIYLCSDELYLLCSITILDEVVRHDNIFFFAEIGMRWYIIAAVTKQCHIILWPWTVLCYQGLHRWTKSCDVAKFKLSIYF